MKRSPLPSAVLLDRLASGLFGRDWAARVADLTGRNRRQVARVMAAGRAGREHPAAADIGLELCDALAVILKGSRALAGHWRQLVQARAHPPAHMRVSGQSHKPA